MTKRLQIIIQDLEYRKIRRMALARRVSIAEWVCRVLSSAQPERTNEPVADIGKKLEVIHIAVQHEYPAGDIESMLTEIEKGTALALIRESSHQPHRIHIHNHLRSRNLLLFCMSQHGSQQGI